MRCYYLAVLLALTAVSLADKSDDDRKKAVDKSKQILTDLYITLRNIAFPESPLASGVTNNRFILLSPGKVLNYWDYYPGSAYELSLLRQNASAQEAVIPPAVMEKWFDIADVMVGADPFNGGTSGKSMATVYETIISQMELLGLGSKSSDAERRYNEGRNYLTGVVLDPENPAINSTRLTLYKRYQDLYTQRQLEMEEKIEDARQSRNSIDYELWFQRNYPAISTRIEGAYTQWLVFGEKERVELYKAYMDVASSGSEVEKAKMSLRASGVTSLDRTRTIYPVSFEPGNWYKYLLPKYKRMLKPYLKSMDILNCQYLTNIPPIKGPSRDMILAKKSLVESEIGTLKTMIAFSSTNQAQANATLEILNRTVTAATELRDNKTEEAIKARHECQQANAESTDEESTKSGPCAKLKDATEDAVDSAFTQAQANSNYQSAAFTLNSKKQFNSFLNARISSLESELTELENELKHADAYLGPIAESHDFQDLNKLLNETEQSLDDEWVQFEYDSDSTHVNTSQETNSLTVAAGLSVGLPNEFGLGLGVNVGKSDTDLKQAISSADLKVAGELLRVTIKRPWFKPSIFEDTTLSFSQRNEAEQKNTFVSPGPKDERTFRDYVAGTKSNLYLFPEYVTSFLLARDVKLQFSGVDAKSASHMTQLMVGVSLSASYDMFSLSASVGVNKMKQTATADRTANGMIINIPGAQIIGYYTSVLPQFPINQK